MTSSENSKPLLADVFDREYLIAGLKQSLRDNIFSGRLRISPRRVGQVSEQITDSFLWFRDRAQEPEIYSYGEELAKEGVGHRAILALTEKLRHMCWEAESLDAQCRMLTSRYIFSLLEGYMAGREAYLLAEQERARIALERAREKRGL